MKHHRFIPLLAACLALCACQPDPDLADGLVLHIEGSAATGAKPAVDGINTAWINGDIVSINGSECTVSVSGSTATLPNVTAPRSGEHYFAFSPASLCPQADPNVGYADPDFWWEHHLAEGSEFRFTYPREYTYEESSGRQKLASPMVAVAGHDASSLTFRHLAAALQVEIVNPMNKSIYIDSVVVEAANACLNGDASFTIAPSTSEPSTLLPTVTSPSASSPTYFERSVRISFSGQSAPSFSPSPLASGTRISENSSLNVQIPLPPLPAGTQLTVRVYGKTATPMGNNNNPIVGRQGNATPEKFTFQRQASLTTDLGRTALIRAGAPIRPDGDLLDEEGSISRLSVFSLADNKQVLFRRNCTTGTYTPSMAEIDSLTTNSSRAEARFLRLESASGVSSYLIIFPDGTTMASVRSNFGIDDNSLPDDKFNNYNGATTPSILSLETRARNSCNTHGYLFLKTGTNSTRNYYKLSDGYMTGSGSTVDEYRPGYGSFVQEYEVDFKAVSLIGS